jgi:hypothetical protein
MGKIELDHTGSGGGITLSSDGTSLLLDGSAVGGSALELYAENPSSPTAPSALGTNGIAIGDNAQALNFDDALAIGSSSLANNIQTQAVGRDTSATGSRSSAFGRSATASNSWSTAVGYGPTASGTSSLALGRSATAAGDYSTAITNSYASGAAAFAAVITNNTSSYGATGANSVAIGQFAKATQTNAVALNGTASGVRSIAIGSTSSATATNATAIGYLTTAVGSALALGVDANAQHGYSAAILRGKSEQQGKMAFSGMFFGTKGDAQGSTFVLVADTTDATATSLTGNNLSASTNNQIILPNNSAYAFHGTIVARQKAGDGTASAAWKIEGLIRREGSAGTTVLVNSATTVLDNTPSWGMALSADTTNGGLKIEVTGAAATNIRWVATIHTSEVTYA